MCISQYILLGWFESLATCTIEQYYDYIAVVTVYYNMGKRFLKIHLSALVENLRILFNIYIHQLKSVEKIDILPLIKMIRHLVFAY